MSTWIHTQHQKPRFTQPLQYIQGMSYQKNKKRGKVREELKLHTFLSVGIGVFVLEMKPEMPIAWERKMPKKASTCRQNQWHCQIHETTTGRQSCIHQIKPIHIEKKIKIKKNILSIYSSKTKTTHQGKTSILSIQFFLQNVSFKYIPPKIN